MEAVLDERDSVASAPGISVSDVLASLTHRDETHLVWIAFGIALVLHLGVMLLDFPDLRSAVQPRPRGTFIVVKKYVPPPPPVERRQVTRSRQDLARRLPVPDPTPDEPEPIREPVPEVELPPLPPDVEFLIGVPELPPPTPAPAAPLIPGTGDVTFPVLIEESKVRPEYPELARVARLECDVILRAVIRGDGTVADLVVMRVTRPQFGFEEAAIEAVGQWRYRPALHDGKPVDVYLTVFIEFELH